jgi:DNA polymerase-3 subunit alpha (Gram-positive type)
LKIIFFDLETTGLSSAIESILEVAAVVIDENYNILDTYHSFINPGKRIPPIITKLTGITDATVRTARTEYIVVKEFMEWVKGHSAQYVAGHNVKSFDINWIKTKVNKYGLVCTFPTEVIDTLEYSKRLYKEGVLKHYTAATDKGNVSFKLEHLINYFELTDQTHRAIDDVTQNIIVYRKLKELEETIDFGF